MSQFVIILGRSGSGKSTSLKNLNPEETFVINCLGKPLPFKGSFKKYNKEAKNYVKTYKYDVILKWLEHINNKMPQVKNIVLDDCTYVMREEFFDRSNERGYDKYNELADHFRRVINTARSLRDDLHIYMMLHDSEVETDGIIVSKKVATVGKLLDKMYDPLQSVSICLYCEPKYTDDGVVEQYGFYTKETKINGIILPAKTPEGMFEEAYIPNDLSLVNEIIDKYYNE